MPAGGGLTLGLIAAGAAIKGAQAIGAGVRQHRLNKQLRKLGTPQYGATPQLLSYYDRALQESLAPKGLSPEAVGAYNQQIAGQTTGNIRNAQRLGGGNISSQINAALNNANVIGATNLATTDANLRNQNRQFAFNRLGSATNQLQGIQNMNTGINLERIRALGKAASDARMTANYALGDLGNSAISAGGFASGGGFGGQGLTPQTTTTPGSQFYLGNVAAPEQGMGYNDETMTTPSVFGPRSRTRTPNFTSFYTK